MRSTSLKLLEDSPRLRQHHPQTIPTKALTTNKRFIASSALLLARLLRFRRKLFRSESTFSFSNCFLALAEWIDTRSLHNWTGNLLLIMAMTFFQFCPFFARSCVGRCSKQTSLERKPIWFYCATEGLTARKVIRFVDIRCHCDGRKNLFLCLPGRLFSAVNVARLRASWSSRMAVDTKDELREMRKMSSKCHKTPTIIYFSKLFTRGNRELWQSNQTLFG